MEVRRFETGFFSGILGVALVFFLFIMWPNMGALVLAATLALVFYPLYQRLIVFVHHKSIAALTTVAIVVIIVFIPLGVFATKVFGDATTLYASIRESGGINLANLVSHLPNANLFPIGSVATHVNDILSQILGWFIQNLGLVFSGLAQALSTTFLALFGLFYFLKDADRLKRWTLDIIPLELKYTELIIEEVRGVMNSVIKGTVVVAILQGVVAGVGFMIFGIPDPSFWGSLVILCSPIPLVGAWLTITPAIIYLLLSGQTLLGIGLFIWSVVTVNIIYSIISPLLMHRGNNMHPLIILLSMIGGIMLLGPIGFLTGPFISAFLFSLLNIYPKLILRKEM